MRKVPLSIGLDPQKHPMQFLLILGLSIYFLFAWIHLAQTETGGKKARWRANLICYHNPYAPVLTPGIVQPPKISFPRQKTRLDKCITPYLKQ